ncbi:MAG: aldo/keto reductase [Planctomycetota bacterium]|nr:aldo/keto reductase [Planctomycetota bacterium]
MIYRRFGRTELQMPVFSCGGMRYQHSWKDEEAEGITSEGQANLEATIRRSVELGINHIETARGYGTSEIQLGRILPKLDRDKIIVQTKVAPCDDSAEFRKTFDQSMSLLKLDHVELLGLHGVNNQEFFDWAMRPGGSLDEAEKLRKAGRVKHIGFSTHGPVDLIIQAIESGRFDYVNLHYYWIYQNNWAAVEAATRHDMGVFIISPSDKGGMLYQPPEKLVNLCKPLSPMVFNDLFCLSHPQIHTLSIGAAKPSDFDEHVEGLKSLQEAEAVLAPILIKLSEAYQEALGAEWLASWQNGLPKWEQTPGNMNLPIVIWLWNLLKAFDLKEYARMRYNLLGNGGHWFPGLNAEKLNEVESLIHNQLEGYPYRDKAIAILKEMHSLVGGEAVKRLSTID